MNVQGCRQAFTHYEIPMRRREHKQPQVIVDESLDLGSFGEKFDFTMNFPSTDPQPPPRSLIPPLEPSLLVQRQVAVKKDQMMKWNQKAMIYKSFLA